MADQLSPGAVVRELDLVNRIAAVGLTGGAHAGSFRWGPAFEITRLADENKLVETFGKPTDSDYMSFLCVADFLAYTGDVQVVRVIDEDARNSTDDGTGVQVKNAQEFEVLDSASGNTAKFIAKYAGALGDSIAVSIADASNFATWEYKDLFDTAPGTSRNAAGVGGKNDEMHLVVVDKNGQFSGVVGGVLETYSYLSKASDAKDENNLNAFYKSVLNARSKYVWALEVVEGTSTTSTTGGQITGVTVTAGGADYVSGDTVAVTGDGTGATATVTVAAGAITAVTITNPGTGYTSATVTVTSAAGTGATFTAVMAPVVTESTVAIGSRLVDSLGKASNYNEIGADFAYPLTGGKDSVNVGAQEIIQGYKLMENAEQVDVANIFTGDAGGQTNRVAVNQYAIDMLGENRKDLVVTYSCALESILGKSMSQQEQAILADKDLIARGSSYAATDSGWKLVYDVYNNKNRYIPLNPSVAGLMARVSNEYDDWWSPAGYTRGKIKNCIRLVCNPDKPTRDGLYKNGVNCVVTFKNDGTILYGDRTTQGKNSAFSYIGIRRLFIRLRKAVGNAAKYSLFEFNDEYTQAAARNMIEPYMREIKGRRGLHDYKVVCDSTNNTDEVIQRGEFKIAIYVKPQYSIQWVILDLVAVDRSVAFEEVAGSI